MMKIRVTQCSRDTYWYQHMIGQAFEVQSFSGDEVRVYRVSVAHGAVGIVLKQDCEVVTENNGSEAELRSLKQSIIESGLLRFAPAREMSFHDRVVFAISELMKQKPK